MPFQYKVVLLVGATSGIGAAMADRLVQEGSKVIAVGRRQSRLDAFVQKHGKDKADAAVFDIGDRKSINTFVNSITKQYPALDCVFLNAGTQSRYDLGQPDTFDLGKFHDEISINFSSLVDLSMGFLPFLRSKNSPTSIIFTGTHLGLVPAATLPAYSASKAALQSFILCLREQLETQKSQVKIIELWPPVVQTELHDYMGEEKGRSMGMPVNEYVDQTYKGLEAGKDQILVGAIGPPETFYDIVDKRRTTFHNLAKMMRNMM